MSSTGDDAQLSPVLENDAMKPGSFYTACLNSERKSAGNSYWVVMRVPLEWLPQDFFDTRPLTRVFPFWIVGRDQRVWLPRSSLYYPHESQSSLYLDQRQRQEFKQTINLLATLKDPHAALTRYERAFQNSTQNFDESRVSLHKNTQARTQGWSATPSQLLDRVVKDKDGTSNTDIGQGDTTRKRIHADRHAGSDSTILSMTRKRQKTDSARRVQSKNAACDVVTKKPKIIPSVAKAEPRGASPADQGERSPAASKILKRKHVRIYIGPQQQEFLAESSVLQRMSPVLYSMISKDDGTVNGYIMQPRLRSVDSDDFYAIMKYIHKGDFHPKLIESPEKGLNEPKQLGELTTIEEYSQFAMQAGRLYLLVKEFQVKGMEEAIAEKVMKGQYKKYSNMSLIHLARRVMFGPRDEHANASHAPAGTIVYNQFERWIIDQLAEKFMGIMGSEAEHEEYLKLIYATYEKQTHAAILEATAVKYREIGLLVEAVKDCSS